MGLFNRRKKKREERERKRQERPKKKFMDTKFGGFLKKVGQKLPDIAGDVLDIATSGTPVSTAIDIIKDKIQERRDEGDENAGALLYELEIKRAEWEQEFKLYSLDVDDRISAREMYATENEMADNIARSIINYNLLVIGILIVVEVACIFFLRDHATILALISGVIGAVIQALINERLTVVNFFYGSSKGSKEKQVQIMEHKMWKGIDEAKGNPDETENN